jgi:tetratricopeptide (TPR) repeat protein
MDEVTRDSEGKKMSASNWYIARDKKKLGPYSTAQMKQMAELSQLLPTEMVLQDGTTQWKSASQVQEFFPVLASAAPPPLPPPLAPEPAEWHFTQNGQQAGPVTWSQLRQRAASGQLQSTDMVWKGGMAGWVAASTINDLVPLQSIAPPPLPPLTGPVKAAVIAESEAHFDRGSKCVKEGSFERAILHFTRAIALDPNYAEAYAKRRLCHNKIGEFPKAIADSSEAIRISPNNASYYDGRATDYCDNGDEERAIADSKEALRLEPYNRHFADRLADFYNHFGIQHQKANAFGKAILCVTEAIKLKPNDAQFYYNRGNYHVQQDDYAAAFSDFEKAVQLDPSHTNSRDQLKQVAVVIYYNRAMKQYNAKNYKDALADFEKAYNVDPGDSDFQNMLRKTRHALGINATDPANGGASVPDSPSKTPTASWPPGLYYYMNGTWHPGPKTEEDFAKLIKNKSITLDTFAVRVPENLTPVRISDSLTAEEIEEYHRIANKPAGFWSALKAKGFLGATANLLGAVDGKWTCAYCREGVRYGATICPHCRSEILY